MITKTLEIRDEGTHIPCLAIRMVADNEIAAYYIHERTGHPRDGSSIVLMRLNDMKATNDPYEWPRTRTMPNAHYWIIENFDSLSDGDVVDVRYILGETTEPCKSDRLGGPYGSDVPV